MYLSICLSYCNQGTAEYPISCIVDFLKGVSHGIFIMSYVRSEAGWRLSHTAATYPQVYHALLHVAAYTLSLKGCVSPLQLYQLLAWT